MAYTFLPTTTYSDSGFPTSVTTADINGDGKLDLVIANHTNSVEVRLGNPDGSFGAATPFTAFSAGSTAFALTADLNGDGKPDLIVTNFSNNGSVAVLFNTTAPGATTPSFSAATTYATGALPVQVVTGDFNGDGKLDFIVANASATNETLALNNGNGTFTTSAISTGVTSESVATADVNGDGKLDLIALDSGGSAVGVFLGNGSGTFQAPNVFQVGNVPNFVTTADLNGDGKLDLITANFNDGTVSVLLGNGAGGFAQQATYQVGTRPGSISVVDVDGDGHLDLVVANNGNQNTGAGAFVSVLLGTGTGTFAAQSTIQAGTSPTSVTTADVNRDGHLDIITTNASPSGFIAVLDGAPAFDVTSIVATSPHPGTPLKAGDVVGINVITDASAMSISGSAPTLTLSNGATAILLGNAGNSLSFAYTVQAGQDTSDLQVTGIGNSTSVQQTGTGTFGFAAQSTLSVGSSPVAITTADLNHDGNLDIITANSGTTTVSVRLGTGGGAFGAENTFTVGSVPDAVTTADINGDGKLDLIVANVSGNTVSVLLNTTAQGASTPTFAAQSTLSTGASSSPEGVATADINGDGKADIISADFNAGNVMVFLNTTAQGASTPAFAAGATFAAGTGPVSVAAADLNGDGKVDLVTANAAANTLSVLLNTTTQGASSATFATQVTFSTSGASPSAVTVADVNGDGHPDLIAAIGTNAVGVRLGTGGTGSSMFGAQVTYATGTGASSVTAADVNGDGKLDLEVANFGTTTVSVLLGNGDGTFGTQQTFTVGTQPRAIATADVNGDGKPDILTANDNASGTVSVLLNQSKPKLIISSLGAANVSGHDTGFIVDTTPPATPAAPFLVSDNGLSDSDNITKNPEVHYPTAAAGDVLLFKLDSGSFSTTAPTFVLNGTSDGTHLITIEEKDAAGNISGTSSLTFTLDTTPPGTPPAPVLHNDTGTPGDKLTSDPTIDYPTPPSGHRLLYQLDGGVFLTSAPTFGTNSSADGTHTVTIQEQDLAGNLSAGTSSLTFTLNVAKSLTGTSGNDTFTSGPGNDTYNGAVGFDTVVYSHAESAYTITHSGANLIVSGPDGTDTLTSIEKLQFSDTSLIVTPRPDDFDGNGTSDVMLRNNDGSLWINTYSGTTMTGGGPAGSPATHWDVVGTGDFNNDGHTDVMLRDHASGVLWINLYNGTNIVGSGLAGAPTTDWDVAGVGDFNGDGFSDILLRDHATGELWVNLYNGVNIISSGPAGSPTTDWDVAGIADFNRDGYSDVLLHNHLTGELYINLYQGLTPAGSGTAGHPTTDWDVGGVGDFNGDGYSDVLLHNHVTGELYINLYNGVSIVSSGTAGHPSTDYDVARVADYNDDGFADVMLRNHVDGSLYMNLYNGLTPAGSGPAGTPSLDWQFISV
jgi:hypothetical protein